MMSNVVNKKEREIKQVLIVDDGLPFRVMMKKIIEKYFYASAHLATNPKEAFDLVPRIKPSLIVLDMQMPVMDGFTALKHFRILPETKYTPVVAFSALGNENLIAELVKWKISDFIRKPSTTEVIVKKLTPFLDLKYEM